MTTIDTEICPECGELLVERCDNSGLFLKCYGCGWMEKVDEENAEVEEA